MKRILLLVPALTAVMALRAQTPYPPAPPPPGNMVQFEYFFNTDPGAGNATPITVPAPQVDLNNFAFNIPTTGLPQGYYRLYLRSRDANGRWSHAASAFFSNVTAPVYPGAPPAPVNIVKLEYAIDANPPFGSGTDIPILPGFNIANQNVSISTTGVPPAPHILYIRSQDANGQWSLTNITFFDNSVAAPYPLAPAPATALQQMEYFIDTDPGFGLATPVTITPGTDITTSFSVTGLPQGIYNFYIRSRNNPWGLTTVVPFVVGTVTPVSWLYVKGEIKNKISVIEWATANEQNSKQFELEHSTDGRTYVPIATVAAAGNSSTQKNYSALHGTPHRGVNFYRIKQVDADGSFRYSAIISLFMQSSGGMQVSPNPARNYFVLMPGGPAAPAQLNLYNSSGQRVMQQQLPAAQRHTINTNGLPAGQYSIEIITAGKKQRCRVQLQ
jgi:Secretion system C-terminal sorting domain